MQREARSADTAPANSRTAFGQSRVEADGNHLVRGGAPFRVRGVTYGTFAPRADGALFPETSAAKQDLADIADAGLNTVRTYTTPPDDIIDLAEELGLYLLVGVHYEDWRHRPTPGRATHRDVRDAGRRAVDATMERLTGRPNVLAVSVGNEVPGDVVRVHGIREVEEVLGALVDRVHAADPGMLATYANFPTTEYLDVPGQDLACFNVFLEDRDSFRRYLKRLQVRTGDVPLLVTELGLAAGAHGEDAQAKSLAWQLETVDEVGCAGATVFSWTDDWTVADHSQEDWGFGITDVDRRPKPALDVVTRWAHRHPEDLREDWPEVSVVVCAYNEGPRIRACMESLERVTYPNLEVIVCDDGSEDDTLAIVREFPFRVLELPHAGLSAARNAGIDAASGGIVAFLDADAQCHPDWPYHLALSLEEDGVVATGGPNLPLEDAPLVEHAVAASPGGPMHVLVADDRAEHVPGCNMAFEKWALEEIGGFNPAYTSAGDDVDVCWKLLDRGHEIGFSQAAQVRHHRRATVRGYLKQQRGYGRAEKMLSGAHPHRFNRLGQARWSGFIYGGLAPLERLLRPVVYHGHVGEAPYQGITRPRAERALAWAGAVLPVGVAAGLAGVALAFLSLWWLALTGAGLALLAATWVIAGMAARPPQGDARLRFRLLVGFFHVAQPLARTWGRLRGDEVNGEAPPPASWSGDRIAWLRDLRREFDRQGCTTRFGGEYDRWDLEAGVGPFVRARLTTAVTWDWVPHVRVGYRVRPVPVAVGLFTGAVAAVASLWAAAVVVGFVALGGIVDALELRSRVREALDTTVSGIPSESER